MGRPKGSTNRKIEQEFDAEGNVISETISEVSGVEEGQTGELKVGELKDGEVRGRVNYKDQGGRGSQKAISLDGADDSPDYIPDPGPVEPIFSPKLSPGRDIRRASIQEQMSEIERLRMENEALKAQLSTALPLEELMKDRYYGTTSYLIVTRQVEVDPTTNKKIYTQAELSAFPDTVDKITGKLLAPDRGFDDNREEADALRESNTPIKFRGKIVAIKDAIQILRNEYYVKRLKGDREFSNQAILMRQ